jgi:hypothetical protein
MTVLTVSGSDLTDRELQVLRLVARGRTNAVAIGYHRGLLLAPKGLTREVITRLLAEQREVLAAGLEAWAAASYPESVFRPDSELPDGIAGTAMRHAYVTAARLIRERRLPGDEANNHDETKDGS